MPLVRISLKQEVPAERRLAISKAVHRALVSALGVPEGDRFQVISTHGEDLVYDPSFLGMSRGDGIVMIQVFMASGRSVELKKALFKALCEGLGADAGVRPDDVFVNIVEMGRENWSFGGGIAQYADAPPPHLASAAR